MTEGKTTPPTQKKFGPVDEDKFLPNLLTYVPILFIFALFQALAKRYSLPYALEVVLGGVLGACLLLLRCRFLQSRQRK